MNAVIIDDDRGSITTLTEMLTSFQDIHLLGSATSVIDGISLLQDVKPELLFLDIELKDGNGFDILEAMGQLDIYVIFSTSHQHYALEAIKLSAVDYLLKPYGIAELYTALQKISKYRISEKNPSKVLIGNSYQTDLQKKKIGIHTVSDIQFVVLEDIILCKADGNYTEFILTNGLTLLASSPLKKYGELLHGHGFYRANKSNLVNMHHIKKYVKAYGGSVLLENGEEVTISRRNKYEFMSLLEQYHNFLF